MEAADSEHGKKTEIDDLIDVNDQRKDTLESEVKSEEDKKKEEKKNPTTPEEATPNLGVGDVNESLFMKSNEVFGAVKIKDGLFAGD